MVAVTILTVVAKYSPEIRFTPTGAMVAIFEAYGHEGWRFEAWEESAKGMDEIPYPSTPTLRVDGYKKVVVRKNAHGNEFRLPTFIVKKWTLLS